MTSIIESFRGEFLRYRALGRGRDRPVGRCRVAGRRIERQQFDRRDLLAYRGQPSKSRFTDFLTSDGEKPWRHRDDEFEERSVTREALLEQWDAGWDVLLHALGSLTDEQIHSTVVIRRQTLTVHEALCRSLAHLSYHVGQIVYIAKARRGETFNSLSIPRGASDTFHPKR